MNPTPALTARHRLTAALAAVFTLALALVLAFGAAPARAHGGGMDAQIGQDGVGGVYVSFAYVEDGHPVEALLDASVEGLSATGEIVGPIPLTSASQGVGIWETPAGAFGAGQWELTVRVTGPESFEKKVPIEIVMADVVEDEHGESGSSDVSAAGPESTAALAEGFGTALPVGVGIALVVAATITVVLIVRRRRDPSHR